MTIEEKPISIRQFWAVIRTLGEDEPDKDTSKEYINQKDHWRGWLRGYYGPGAYGRKNWHRDAKFVYNHVVCPGLLIYLIRELEIDAELVEKAENAFRLEATEMERAGKIRNAVPWSVIYQAILPKVKPTLFERVRNWKGKGE